MLYRDLLSDPVRRLGSSQGSLSELQSYLALIRENTGRDPGGIDLSTIEGFRIEGERVFIEAVSRSALNRAIFSQEAAVTPSAPAKPMRQDLRTFLAGINGGSQDARVKRAEEGLTRMIREAEGHSADLMEAFANITEAAAKLKMMKGSTDLGLITQIEEALASGFWKSPRYRTDQSLLTLETDDVWVNFNDHESRVNKSYNSGRWQLRIEFNRGVRFNINPIEPAMAIVVNRYPHPHVNREGVVCLGNAATSFSEAAAAYDVGRMLKIVRTILTTYNAGNPYVTFDRFEEEYKKRLDAISRLRDAKRFAATYEATLSADGDDEEEDDLWDEVRPEDEEEDLEDHFNFGDDDEDEEDEEEEENEY